MINAEHQILNKRLYSLNANMVTCLIPLLRSYLNQYYKIVRS